MCALAWRSAGSRRRVGNTADCNAGRRQRWDLLFDGMSDTRPWHGCGLGAEKLDIFAWFYNQTDTVTVSPSGHPQGTSEKAQILLFLCSMYKSSQTDAMTPWSEGKRGGFCNLPFRWKSWPRHFWSRTVGQTRQLKRSWPGMAQAPCWAAEASICMHTAADEATHLIEHSVRGISGQNCEIGSRNFGTVVASICSPETIN